MGKYTGARRRGLIIFTLAFALSGCGSADRRSNPSTSRWSAVSWSTLVRLVRNCQAVNVGQTHTRLVTLTARDGRKVWAREPRIDAIIPVVNRAISRCGPITFATE